MNMTFTQLGVLEDLAMTGAYIIRNIVTHPKYFCKDAADRLTVGVLDLAAALD